VSRLIVLTVGTLPPDASLVLVCTINCVLCDVLLTVHLSIFILVINQLDARNLFYSKFISFLYMFRATFGGVK